MSYALWKAEKRNPTPEDRRSDRTTEPSEMLGFWRIVGARTKPDFPVAIWQEDGSEAVIFQIGRQHPMNTIGDAEKWHEFTVGSWLKCVAVERADWDAALETGRWPDGKKSRELTDEEQADIIPTTSPEEGGNAPIDEAGDIYEQVKARLELASEKAKALGPINSMEKATAAAEIVELISTASRIGEARRKAEKKPHDDAAAEVQAKWVPILTPASELATSLKQLIQRFKDAEEARLRREREEEQRRERERIQQEERERLEREAAQRAEEARENGEEPNVPTPEQIEERAAQVAEEQLAAQPQVETTVRVGTAHGRGITVAKRKVGRIVDVDKFIAAIKDQEDFKTFLQDKANKLARANTKLDGMEIDKE